MTNQQHPITPPPELVQQWCHEDGDEIKTSPNWYKIVCTKAARWGADQELEACCELVANTTVIPLDSGQWLRSRRRPKPPSLKEQALGALYAITSGADDTREFYQDIETIKTALEQLDD